MSKHSGRLGKFTSRGTRKNNEDHVIVEVNGESTLLVICDGLGGHLCGDIASEIAAKSVAASFQQRDSMYNGAFLRKAIEDADVAIRSASVGYPNRIGMGTTIVTAVVSGRNIMVANVGDSRAYQIRGRLIRRLTSDHLEVVKSLGISEQLGSSHEMGHVLSQALGLGHGIDPFISEYEIWPKDRIILCTDGVSSVLNESMLVPLARHGTANRCAELIVRYAIASGSSDNCTAALVIA